MQTEHGIPNLTEIAKRLASELLTEPRRVLGYQTGDGVHSVVSAAMTIAFKEFISERPGQTVQVLDASSSRTNWEQFGRLKFLNLVYDLKFLTPLRVAAGRDVIDPRLPLFANGSALTFDRNRALWKAIADVWPKMDTLYVSVPINEPRKSIYMVELVHHFDKGIYVYPEDIK